MCKEKYDPDSHRNELLIVVEEIKSLEDVFDRQGGNRTDEQNEKYIAATTKRYDLMTRD